MYNFRVSAINSVGAGNSVSANSTTTDGTAPSISSVSSTPSNTSVTITWTTDEASSSIVDYGLTNSYGTTTVEADTIPRVTSHSVTVNNLIACTTYNYRVKSNDAASNLATGSNNTFTTTGCVGDAEVLDENQSSIPTATGGSVNLLASSYGLSLSIPAGATDTDAIFQIKKLDADEVVITTSTPTSKSLIGEYTYELKSLSSVDEANTSFNEEITITISYSDSDLSGYDESSLVIYRWNGSAWVALDGCVIDTNLNTITCTTTNFSLFALFGQTQTTPAQIVSTNGAVSVAFLQALSNQNNQTQTKTTIGCKEGYAFSPVNGLPCNNTKTNTNEFVAEKTKFTKNLKLGMKDTQVKLLQEYLNNNGFLVASTGPGSKGKETTLFGRATRNALIKFQKANNINPAVGYFGPLSRGFVNK